MAKGQNDEPERDFTKMFDLNRSTLVADLVNRMETCMRTIKDAQEDLKQLVGDCHTEHEFGPKDIAAMKKVAKLRLDDKGMDAKAQLAAQRLWISIYLIGPPPMRAGSAQPEPPEEPLP